MTNNYKRNNDKQNINQDLNTADTINIASDNLNPCKNKSNKNMSLVQNGKHVNLVTNEIPWYTNTAYISPEDLSQLNKSYHEDSNQSTHNSFIEKGKVWSKKVELGAGLQDMQTSNSGSGQEGLKHNLNVSSLASSTILEPMSIDKPISNKYLPYTLLYLLIFLAVLLLIYKLGVGSMNASIDV